MDTHGFIDAFLAVIFAYVFYRRYCLKRRSTLRCVTVLLADSRAAPMQWRRPVNVTRRHYLGFGRGLLRGGAAFSLFGPLDKIAPWLRNLVLRAPTWARRA